MSSLPRVRYTPPVAGTRISDNSFVIEPRSSRRYRLVNRIRILTSASSLVIFGWLGILMIEEGENFQQPYAIFALAFVGLAVSFTAQSWMTLTRKPSERDGVRVAFVLVGALIWLAVIALVALSVSILVR